MTLVDSKRPTRGFTIIELLIVVAIIAVVAAMAIPRLQQARLQADESAAIGTLRSIYAAQIQVQAGRQIDSNGDGLPEFGYLAELSGAAPIRINGGAGPIAGAPGVDELEPSVLVSGIGAVTGGVASRSGYLFQMYLPGPTAAGAIPGIAEDANGGKLAAPFPDANNATNFFCAYAWPTARGRSGLNAFVVNEDGQVLKTRGTVVPYSAVGGGPAYDAAFTVPNDISSELALNGLLANDGNQWDLIP